MPTDHLLPPPYPPKSKKQLLKKVADEEGFPTILEMLEKYAIDSVVPGICTSCEGIEVSCEPDAQENYCGECDANTVQSVMVLAGVI